MFINQAYKGKNNWWRVLITTLFTAGICLANFIMYFLMSKKELDEAYKTMDKLPKNISLVINLLPFIFLLVILFLLVRFLHKRSILSITTSRNKIDFKLHVRIWSVTNLSSQFTNVPFFLKST